MMVNWYFGNRRYFLGCCCGDLVMVDLSNQIWFVLSGPFSGFRCNYCVGELILECGIKCKKVRCRAFIGGCKNGIIHPLLIECILLFGTN